MKYINVTNRSKSYYKLKELDEKLNVFNGNISILDIGCYPGGWARYIYKKSKLRNNNFRYVGIDLIKTSKIGSFKFVKGNFFNYISLKKIFFLFSSKFDIIISDLCPNFFNDYNKRKFLKNILLKLFEYSSLLLKKNGKFIFKSMNYINFNKNNKFLSCFKNISNKVLKNKKKKSSEIYYFCDIYNK